MKDDRPERAANRAAALAFFRSRPTLSPKSERYYAEWLSLSRYRPMLSHGLGMAGAMLLKQLMPRAEIEAEGVRLGYANDALDDFVELMTRFNVIDLRADMKRQSKEIAEAQKKHKPPGRNPI